jgi:uncharacterized protein YbaP (TraB family)
MAMKMKISLIVIGLLGLLAPLSHAEDKLADKPVISAAVTTPQRGTLYRVRHKGNTSYLFGTIHVGKPEFYPLNVEVTDALAKATKVALELDTRNVKAVQVSMQKHAMYAAGDSIKNHLSEGALTRLKQALEKANIPLEAIAQMRPWLVADLLLVQDIAQGGYDRTLGIEEYLVKAADQGKKQVIELEGADFQFALFNRLNEQQQEQFLLEVLDEIKDGKARTETEQLANAWGRADIKEMMRLIDDNLNEKTVASEFTKRVLLDERNPGMAKKIEGLLKYDKVTFVGVGLLHLVGEKSVPELLRKKGYAVERIY